MPTLAEIQKSKNVAELLSDEKLVQIGQTVLDGLTVDEESKSEWQMTIDKTLETAKQIMSTKNYPWKDASNVKFPLLTNAALSFAAREFPEIIKDDRVVKSHIVSGNGDPIRLERNDRVATFMSYQLLFKNNSWAMDMDRLLHMLPLIGTIFKKIWWDTYNNKLVIDLCFPDKIIVNYSTDSLENAPRITHILDKYKNDIVENVRRGIYIELTKDEIEGLMTSDHTSVLVNPVTKLAEQHCYLDLDDDGYDEPYVVTIHKTTGKVLRIAPRFRSVEKNSKGEVICIEPEHYFVDYHFFRAFDGGFYGAGFNILYSINKAIDTLINQLIDSGTLNNLQAGLLGRGIRLEGGDLRLSPGEWKFVDTLGDDLAKNVFPLPTKEPSQTLFQVLGLLIEVGKDMSGTADIMKGDAEGQNMPAQTSQILVEQGMTAANAIHKRIYQSLQKEYARIYDLNSRYLDDEEYTALFNKPEVSVKFDFDERVKDIVPVADPVMSSNVQRLVNAQAVLQSAMQPNAPVNLRAAYKYYFEAMDLDQSQIDALMVPPPKPSDPPPLEAQKVQAEIQKLQAEVAALQNESNAKIMSHQIDSARLQLDAANSKVAAEESAARIIKMHRDANVNDTKVQIQGAKVNHEAQIKEAKLAIEQEGLKHDTQMKAADLVMKKMDVQQKGMELAMKPVEMAHEANMANKQAEAQQSDNEAKAELNKAKVKKSKEPPSL